MNIFKIKKSVLSKELELFLKHEDNNDNEIENTVFDILKNIKEKGFEQLKEYSQKFDNFKLTDTNYKVTKNEIDLLASKIDKKLAASLELAISRVKEYHEKQISNSYTHNDNDNNKMGQNILPLDSVAVYVPGGRALYPSTVYMTIIPAIVAGVKRIVLISPPRTFIESSEVARLIQIFGITEVYRIGGAQSIFSLAYGIPGFIKPVDKIVGPGNAFVTKAKQIVYGKVDIDMIAGPSEICIIADTNNESDIPLIAMDILSQAEHDPMARSIIISTNEDYLNKIIDMSYQFLNKLPDNLRSNAESSLKRRGIAILTNDINEAVEISNTIAPEHLELFSDRPYQLLQGVKNAGSVFLGKYTPESVGDYLGGPNHVLPTMGSSRFFSPLGVYDFQKRFSWIEFSKESLYKYYKDIALIARSENLEAHALSAEIRFDN